MNTLTLMMPGYPYTPVDPAPAVLSDTPGSGTAGSRGLSITYDGSNWPQQVYNVGQTPIVYNFGLPLYQGTGWYTPGSPSHSADATKRQLLLQNGATTPTQLQTAAQAFLAYSMKATIKGTVTLGNPNDAVQSDAWAPGQSVQIVDARLPASLNGLYFPIQSVRGQLIEGSSDDLVTPVNNFRVYTLTIGDAPFGRFAQMQWTDPSKLTKPVVLPSQHHQIQVLDERGNPLIGPVTPIPSTPMTLRSQATDPSTFKPVQTAGISVHWDIYAVRDQLGNDQTLQGTMSPTDTFTDNQGMSTSVFTPSAVTGLVYFIEATTPSVGA